MSSSTVPAIGDLATELASPGPVVLAQAEWPTAPGDTLPGVPGFVTSTFSPLVVEVAQRCLHAFFGPAPADPARGERTGVVLASSTGDLATAAAVAQAVGQERRVPPMLFYQSTPNAVVGYLTARWALSGPVVCTVPLGDATADARACADLLIRSGDADAVLVVVADQARAPHQSDHAAALLIGPGSWTERDALT
ncbi:MAG TPA: beta-ketoacyl synthase chain length factor [Streptosporangiaceae bacterium]|jgi:3-oxoacyl-(acyl-carrier-protein) synthase|nr:beta-ketoacyl synthase chain length factor [Streptosporangiaceae bacterium]